MERNVRKILTILKENNVIFKLIYLFILIVSIKHLYEGYMIIRVIKCTGLTDFGIVASEYLFNNKFDKYIALIIIITRDILSNILIFGCLILLLNKYVAIKYILIVTWTYQFITFITQEYTSANYFGYSIGLNDNVYYSYYQVYIPISILFIVINWRKIDIINKNVIRNRNNRTRTSATGHR